MMGQCDKAIKHLKIALKMDPANVIAINNMGLTNIKLGKYNKSIALFKKAIDEDPSFGPSYSNLSGAYIKTNKIDKAIQTLKKLLKIDSNYTLAYVNLSIAYYAKGDMRTSKKYADMAVKYGHKIPQGIVDNRNNNSD